MSSGSRIRVNTTEGSRDSKELLSYYYDNVRTMYEAFFMGATFAKRSNGDERALGYRPKTAKGTEVLDVFVWITYDEMLQRANALSTALIRSLSVAIGQKTMIGIFSQNCPEWMITALACYLQSWVIVPLYSTATDESLAHICSQCDLRICFAKTNNDIKRLVDLVSERKTVLKCIISYDDESLNVDIKTRAAELGIVVMTLNEIVNDKIDDFEQHNPPNPDDLIIICYTSGTTGTPKGVMLTHTNMMSTVSVQTDWLHMIDEPGNEFYLSYLPLTHILEFSLENLCLCNGYKIGYFSGDVKNLSNDIKLFRPTLMATVPRVLSRIYADVKTKTSLSKLGIFRYVVFKLAYRSKLKQLTKAASNKDRFIPPSLSRIPKRPPTGWLSTNVKPHKFGWADKVLSPIYSQFGGRLKLLLVGSSATIPEVLQFIKVVIGCPTIEGYGQTECCGASHSQPFFDMTTGNVGPVLRCCRMKLVDVSDMIMNQDAAHDNGTYGELCIKGTNVFKGYYKDKRTTDLVIDEDGWLHTGDIAKLDPNTNCVSIVERKNEIFKLSQGEFIVPNKVESIYQLCDIVHQCLVYGESMRNFTVAIIVPEKEILLKYAYKQNLISKIELNQIKSSSASSAFVRLCKNKEINGMVISILNAQAAISQLNGFERAKRIYLHPEPLTITDGFLTPTMKIRRSACIKYFRKEIDTMYKDS